STITFNAPRVSAPTDVTFSVQVEDNTTNCIAIRDYVINVKPLPVSTITVNNTLYTTGSVTLCQGVVANPTGFVTLAGNHDAVSGTFTPNGGGASVSLAITNNMIDVTALNASNAGTYTFVFEKDGCDST